MPEKEGLGSVPGASWGLFWDDPIKPVRAPVYFQSAASTARQQWLTPPYSEAGPGLSDLCFLQVHAPPQQQHFHPSGEQCPSKRSWSGYLVQAAPHARKVPACQSEPQVAPKFLPIVAPAMVTLILFRCSAGSRWPHPFHVCTLLSKGSLCPSVELHQSKRG